MRSLVALFALALFTGCYDDGHSQGEGCIFDGATQVPNEGWTHVNNEAQLVYKHNPPASGPHFPVWAGWGEHVADATPLDRGNWVHNLEHGGIVLLLGASASAADEKLVHDGFTAIPDDPECHHRRAVTTKDPKLDTNIAVVAADTVLDNVTVDSIVSFATTCRNHAPEDICY